MKSFLSKLNSRKLLVQVGSWLLGAVLVRYAQDHPQLQLVVSWALGALGVSGGAYHLAVAHEDAAALKAPLSGVSAVGGNVTVTPESPP